MPSSAKPEYKKPLISGEFYLPPELKNNNLDDFVNKINHAAKINSDPDTADFLSSIPKIIEIKKLMQYLDIAAPYLFSLAINEAKFLKNLCHNGFDKEFQTLINNLKNINSEKLLMQRLRSAKKQVALLIALADITKYWELKETTNALSLFAQTTLQTTLKNISPLACENGFFLLAMGKLGAFELNYSSDIDLIALFKQNKTPNNDFVKITKQIIHIISDINDHGYVFRVDMRLRPDPLAYPVAIPVSIAEQYYENFGQTWERAALIKARPIAGNAKCAQEFIDYLAPFLWRRHLDFAAIDDIAAISKKISMQSNSMQNNIKLGKGGIRDIEFFVQIQQLIYGGREHNLRVRQTLKALELLHQNGHLDENSMHILNDNYTYMRNLEHRLQMRFDQQTHSIPDDPQEVNKIASLMGFKKKEDFLNETKQRQIDTQNICQQLLKTTHASKKFVFNNIDENKENINNITSMGFADPKAIERIIRKWYQGKYPATNTQKARLLLDNLLPQLLHIFANSMDPNASFRRFDQFLAALPSGVQLFSLFNANPKLLSLVAEINGNAPRLSQRLAKRPIMLDYVLSPQFFMPLENKKILSQDFKRNIDKTSDYQTFLETTRRWAKDYKFRAGVQILQNKINASKASRAYTNIADILISAIRKQVEKYFSQKYGNIGNLAIVAMGKYGAKELSGASDLDLIFIYEQKIKLSTGQKKLPAQVYYFRLTQRIINAIMAKTQDGELYTIDMRLRPSGKAGPISSSFEAFKNYQFNDAWTWEHLALCKARTVTANPQLEKKITRLIHSVLTSKRNKRKLVEDLLNMRRLIEKQYPTIKNQKKDIWRIKYTRGGIIDTEFIAQFLQLKYAYKYPQILAPATIKALDNARKLKIISAKEFSILKQANLLWRNLDGLRRLCFKQNIDPDSISKGLELAFCRCANVNNFSQLVDKMFFYKQNVKYIFDKYIA